MVPLKFEVVHTMDDMCFQATNGFSLSHDMWKHVRSAFFFEVPLNFESFSPNSSLGARTGFNHVTAEVLSSFPDTTNES